MDSLNVVVDENFSQHKQHIYASIYADEIRRHNVEEIVRLIQEIADL